MSVKRIRGFDSSKIPWDAVIKGGLVLFVLFKAKDIIDSLNPFSKGEAEKQNEESAKDAWWYPAYITSSTCHLLPVADANVKAKVLHDANGTFSNDFSTILAVMKSLKYKSHVACVAAVYANLYGDDLHYYLNDFVNGSSMFNTIVNYVNSLPSGQTC